MQRPENRGKDFNDGFEVRALRIHLICGVYMTSKTASVVYWSEFLATDPEDPRSIPGATRFSEML
jgi:hypothetical protein